MRLFRVLKAGTVALILLLGLVVPGAATADPTYSVMNADGGIYWRSAPDWNTPVAVAGNGVYNGSIVSVHCYQAGTSVPGSADIMWEQATVVGGPGTGSGWLNEHFINDGQPINQPSPGVPPCNPPPPPPAPTPEPPAPIPPAAPPLTFGIYNADGGIYYRNSPHWGDTPQTPGVGVYNGDQVKLICGAFGDPVGPGSNTAWSYVTNLSRNVGNGWVSEHFINDGLAPNQWPTGLPQCGSDTPGAGGGSGIPGGATGGSGSGGGGSGGGSSQPSATGASVYYSPYNGSTIEYRTGPLGKFHKWVSAPSPATITMDREQWQHGCTSSYAVPNKNGIGSGKRITTLAGWSIGRWGPTEVLAAKPSWWKQIHYILLFDPGNKDDYYTGSCDKKWDEDALYAQWLALDPQNTLVVLAGEVTADVKNTVNGHAHAGIQNRLFPAIRDYKNAAGRNVRKQVVVCNYDTMNHEDVWINFKSKMNDAPITKSTCPSANGYGGANASWNP